MSDVVRQEFADRIVSTEEENRRIKNDMSELRVRIRGCCETPEFFGDLNYYMLSFVNQGKAWLSLF